MKKKILIASIIILLMAAAGIPYYQGLQEREKEIEKYGNGFSVSQLEPKTCENINNIKAGWTEKDPEDMTEEERYNRKMWDDFHPEKDTRVIQASTIAYAWADLIFNRSYENDVTGDEEYKLYTPALIKVLIEDKNDIEATRNFYMDNELTTKVENIVINKVYANDAFEVEDIGYVDVEIIYDITALSTSHPEVVTDPERKLYKEIGKPVRMKTTLTLVRDKNANNEYRIDGFDGIIDTHQTI